jgi:hypothetical protein
LVHFSISVSPFINASHAATYAAVFPRLFGLVALSENAFFIALYHKNTVHAKVATAPNCSHACFFLGSVSILGNILLSSSVNFHHILE